MYNQINILLCNFLQFSVKQNVTMSTRFPSVLLLLVLFKVLQVDSCNEAVCKAQVSKCLLTQACRCELQECSCCRDCFQCLGNSFNECCSCVGKLGKNLSLR